MTKQCKYFNSILYPFQLTDPVNKLMIEYYNFRFGEVSDDEEAKKQIYRLRYEVYALEFGFENPYDFPDKLEIDQYDKRSIHFAATNEFDEVIGTVRMIMNPEDGFPAEKAAELTGFDDRPERICMTEVSRLAVSKLLRRRPEDGIHGVESYITKSQGGILEDDEEKRKEVEKENRRKRPVIILGLYRAVYQKCRELGITHMLIITEEKLFHALNKFGFVFKQVGDPVEYHGRRIPSAASWESIERYMLKNKPEILEFLLYKLDDNLVPDHLKSFKEKIGKN